jgi:hypothetical protein
MSVLRALFLSLFTAALLSGQGVTEILEYGYGSSAYGSRASGFANAFEAVADDYSALFWNPAGLGQISQANIYSEIGVNKIANTSTFYGRSLTDTQTNFKLKALGIVLPLPVTRGSLVLAGGYQQRKDLQDYTFFSGFNSQSNGLAWYLDDSDVLYPFDSDVLQSQRISTAGGIGEYTFGGSIAMSPQLLLGASVAVIRGRYEYAYSFFQEDINDNYNEFPANYDSYHLRQQIVADISGWTARVGMLFSFLSKMRLGINVEIPHSLRVAENWQESDNLTYDDGFSDAYENGPWSWDYQIDYSWRYGIGLAWVSRNFTLSTSARYSDLGRARYAIPRDVSLSADQLDLLSANNEIKGLQAHWSAQAGIKWRFAEQWPAFLAGYRYLQSPLPGSSDGDSRKYASVGLELDLGSGSALVISHTIGFWERFSEDPLTPGLLAEDITRQMGAVTLQIGLD